MSSFNSLSPRKAWSLVADMLPGRRLADFRQMVFTLNALYADNGTPLDLVQNIPSGAIIYRIIPHVADSFGRVTFSAAWPSGDKIIIGPPASAHALVGFSGDIQFPLMPLVVPPDGRILWQLDGDPPSTSTVRVNIAHHCLVPRGGVR